MRLLVNPRRFNVSLVDAATVANKLADCNVSREIISRAQRWKTLKTSQINLCASPRIERIKIVYAGYPKPETELSMAKGISTPIDCSKHLTQILRDRSVIALVNGIPHDMHKPLTSDGSLDFVHFKDIHHDPTTCNVAFWNSCQLLMAAALESSFKDNFAVRLLEFPKTSIETGSFVADFRMQLDSADSLEKMARWQASERELRSLSEAGQTIAATAKPYEFLEAGSNEMKELMQDECRMNCVAKGTTPSDLLTAYRLGDYVQIHAGGPLISNTSLIGRFSVVSLRLLGRLSQNKHSGASASELVFRAQGIAVPSAFLTHFTTFDLLMRRAKRQNTTAPPCPDYVEPL